VTGVSGLATRTNVGTSNDNLSAATGTGLSNYAISYVNGSMQIIPAPYPPPLLNTISNRYIDTIAYLQSLFILIDVNSEIGIECNKFNATSISSAKKCITSYVNFVPRVIDGGINNNFIRASLNEY
jgi:hypothetical protein